MEFPFYQNYQEVRIAKYIIDHLSELKIYRNYPYVYRYEYELIPGYSQYGKGDLILTDGIDAVLIVELKHINNGSGSTARTARRKAKRKVEDQALRYAKNFKSSHPKIDVSFIAATNENLYHYVGKLQ